MNNPFKVLETNENVPPELKKKVMEEIAALALVRDLTDVFTLKFGSLLQEVFRTKK